MELRTPARLKEYFKHKIHGKEISFQAGLLIDKPCVRSFIISTIVIKFDISAGILIVRNRIKDVSFH